MKQTKSCGNVFKDLGLPNADVLQSLSNLGIELDILKELIAKQEQPEGLWKPEEGEDVVFLDCEGNIESAKFNVSYTSILRHGNLFKTEGRALAESEKRCIFQDLKELAGGYEFDRENGAKNYYIYNSVVSSKICIGNADGWEMMGQVYFKTHEQAQHAIDTLGEKLRKLF